MMKIMVVSYLMKCKKRKERPQPPKWYWIDSDNCYACKNRNNCNGCKRLKELSYEIKNKKKHKLVEF